MGYVPRWSAVCRHGRVPVLILAVVIWGRSSAQQQRVSPNDTLQSVVVATDGAVTFRIYAPHADSVLLGGGDMPGPARNRMMTRDSTGIWEVAVPPVVPGAYRYEFLVDGVSVLDPRNPAVSESNERAWSLLYIPGAEYMDARNVPHGAVSEVTYYSTALRRLRRMHVYTPPGYDATGGRYPVFYLLHGAWDSDDAWTTVGRAAFILDNLIAAGKAEPMIVVMPDGHTGPFPFARDGRMVTGRWWEAFEDDFQKDIKPFAERHYRVIADRDHRAIAGLSMGGSHALDIAFTRLADYSYIGVFSSGILELSRRGLFGGLVAGPSWEERNLKVLDDAGLKKGLHLLWFATGKDDFLLGTSQATVDLLKKHGFDVVYRETSGAHTWINWREYLVQFVPLLFKSRRH